MTSFVLNLSIKTYLPRPLSPQIWKNFNLSSALIKLQLQKLAEQSSQRKMKVI